MVEVRNNLGLAAYLKLCGAELVSVTDRVFTFKTPIPLEAWRTRYLNSESLRHDALVCELRRYLYENKTW